MGKAGGADMPGGSSGLARGRRIVTITVLVQLWIALLPAALARSDSISPFAQAKATGTQGYVYGIALMEFLSAARTATSVTVPNALGEAPVNQLGHVRDLGSPGDLFTVEPNNDTLYSPAQLDLSNGAMVLHVPAVAHHRYYSFQFIDPYTDVFAYVGTRTTGDGAGNYLIVGPGFQGSVPKGMHEIHSAYNLVWLLGRTLVYGPADVANVRRIQNEYRLLPLSEYLAHGLGWRPARPRQVVTLPTPSLVPSGLSFFDALGTALAQNPPPAQDAPMLTKLRSVGVGPDLQPSREGLGAAVQSGLAAAADGGSSYVATLNRKLSQSSVHATRGWYVLPADTGDFGTDYSLRAVVALTGIAANRPAEAVYAVGLTDSALSKLTGANHYVVRFPAHGLPPARYFWSLTMYNRSFGLVKNSIHRYEIGSRTGGTRRNKDGSLDIYLSRTALRGHASNWLPTPAGVFEVTLRIYGPKQSVLDGHYRWPRIVKTR